MSQGTTTNAPRTIEEFIAQGWVEKIHNKVKKYHLRDRMQSAEDLTQQIICDIISSKYLERYNPELRTFEVYIYVFVINAVKKRAMRENTKNGKLLTTAASLEYSSDETEEFDFNTVYADRLETEDMMVSHTEDIDFEMMLDEVREELKVFKPSSFVEYEGEQIGRDPLTLFNFIVKGFTVADVAEIWHTSKQFVYNNLHKIRSVEAIQNLYFDVFGKLATE